MIDEKKLIEDIEKEFDGVCVYDVSPTQAVSDFVEIVDRQPKVGEWTLCSERMPDRGNKKYLVCGNKGGIYIAKFICAAVNGTQIDPWWDAHGRYCPEPVAWMPLPEAYKEKK